MWTPSEQVQYTQPEQQHSFLDDDDMSAPGALSFDRPTGDVEIDFALFKIAKFGLSDDKRERKLFAETLDRTIAELKDRAGEFVAGVLEALLEDEVDIAGEALDRVQEVAKIWLQLPGSYDELTKSVLPMIWKRLYDSNETLAKKASEAYSHLLPYLSSEDRGAIALTQLLTIAHEEEKETAKVLAIKVLNDTAPLFGRNLCEQFLASELIALADDSSEAVRRAVAGSMKGVFSCVKAPVAQTKLIPALEGLARDPKVSVRRALIDALPSLAQVSSPALFTPVFIQLLKDKNKTVKLLTSVKSGALAAAFAAVAPLPDELLKAFLDLCATAGSQEEIIVTCAQYFPAVVIALGPGRWTEVQKQFAVLSANPLKSVRKTIAAAFHEVAKSIGPALVDKDLVTIYAALTGKNEVEEVKSVALSNFSRFLACLSLEKRRKFCDTVTWMAMARPNWRFREMLSRQLAELAVTFDIETVREELWEAALKLICDNAAAVYIPASQGFGAVATYLLRNSDDYIDDILAMIAAYGEHKNYQKRLLFAHMCGTAVLDSDSFRKYFYELFEKRCRDPVPAVRLVCAEIVRRREWDLGEVGVILRRDEDKEVRKVMEKSGNSDLTMLSAVVTTTEERPWSEALTFSSSLPYKFLYLPCDALLDSSNFPVWLSPPR